MTDIILKNVTKKFEDKIIFSKLNLTFPGGACTCIMGTSGCGKTTLLNLLMKFQLPQEGEILGVPDRISAVFQEDRLCEEFSAIANIRLVTGKQKNRSEILEHLTELGIADSAYLPVRELSGGMKRRVSIARAILYSSDLHILDEAFKGLDEANKQIAMDYVKRYQQGRTLICVTHDTTESDYFGGKLINLEEFVHANQE